MNRFLLLLVAGLFLTACSSTSAEEGARRSGDTAKTIAEPANAGATEVVDTYHGTPIRDPYRWLEEMDAPRTKAWIAAQNERTAAYVGTSVRRQKIVDRLTELWNFPRYGAPIRRGERYYFTKNEGLQNQAVLYWSVGMTGEPKVLIDPNRLSSDGTVSLADWRVSEDGRHVAYATSSGGSDWVEWRVREVDSGKDLKDFLKWVKFSSASWLPDGSGFYYARYPEPAPGEAMKASNRNQKLYFHRLGTTQAEDVLVYERPEEPEWGFGGEVSEDGRFLVISGWVGTDSKNRVFYLELAGDKGVLPLLTSFDATYDFVGNDGPIFYFRTNKGAPRFRVIAVDVRNPDPANWREVVRESNDTLGEVRLVAERLVLTYTQDVRHKSEIRSREGVPEGEIALPGMGSVSVLTGRRSDPEAFLAFASFTQPSAIYRYDFASGRLEMFREPSLKFNPADYETSQDWYSSRDGTRIPMYLVRKKGLQKDGNNPCLLYGYGGFNISIMPSFSVANLVWLEMGGVYAQPALRGGGEYGEAWHEAGMLARKQNVFDDFIAAAEWLVAERWTSPKKLAIQGASNGGLLVGACMTQRPDLFGACLPAVGVMDMLRFHKFTIGWAWVSEYGSADNPDLFKTLLSYSPLHRIQPGTSYPATLVTTADHDDRVVPAHSFKFAAALQAAQAGDAPSLIRIETRAGHGAGVPISKLIEEVADKWSFLSRALNLE